MIIRHTCTRHPPGSSGCSYREPSRTHPSLQISRFYDNNVIHNDIFNIVTNALIPNFVLDNPDILAHTHFKDCKQHILSNIYFIRTWAVPSHHKPLSCFARSLWGRCMTGPDRNLQVKQPRNFPILCRFPLSFFIRHIWGVWGHGTVQTGLRLKSEKRHSF